MGPKRIQKMLEIIAETLDFRETPYALIGSFALNLYGVPKLASDLDLIADQRDREVITARLEKAGFHCCNETDVFSRFESEVELYSRVECMFVRTQDGRDILDRCVHATDLATGKPPVVQPTDYILLKLMAMANQPGRSAEDEADIRSVLECYNWDQVPAWCGPLDKERIESFAGRFGQKSTVEKLFQTVFEPPAPKRVFAL